MRKAVTTINTSINIAGITFKNPIMPASGTFGSGQEYSEFVDLNQLGAVVTKGVSLTPWEGNPAPESWNWRIYRAWYSLSSKIWY